MVDFNFTTDDTTDDSSSETEQSSMFSFSENPNPNPTEIEVTLSDDEMEYIEDLAEQRVESYLDGRTRDEVAGSHTSTEVHYEGLKGELAVSKVYGDGTVDESISAEGDDGTDIVFEVDGTAYDADVKVSQYEPTWIMKKADATRFADAYVVCHSEKDSNVVTIKGWATHDELVQESNVEPSPAGASWDNYTLRNYRNPPCVDEERDWMEIR